MKKAFVLFAALLATAACATSAREQSADTSSEIREMTPEERVGTINYGETLDFTVTTTPKYRAVSFQGLRNEQVQAMVVGRDGTDPVMWLADADFNTIGTGTDASATNPSASVTRFLPKDGTYWIVFREMNFAPTAQFSVSVRKQGQLPAECDPDGEGFSDPACTEPTDSDPFSGTSCDGPDLTAAAAAAKFAPPPAPPATTTPPFRLTNAKIYYRTRQCKVTAGAPDCTAWVRTWLTDTKLTSITSNGTGAYTIAGDTTRAKVKIQFQVPEAAAVSSLKSYCVDGPFTNLRGPNWAPHTDGAAGGCTNQSSVKVTATCARFEPPTIQLNSGSDTYYTEYGSVLLAAY